MSKLIPAAERIVKARALIQKARDLPIPEGGSKYDFSYIAQVKDILRLSINQEFFDEKDLLISEDPF